MFSIFKKKKVVPHVRLTGIIGSAGKFKQGMELANQRDILKKAFAVKKITHVAISINSPAAAGNNIKTPLPKPRNNKPIAK